MQATPGGRAEGISHCVLRRQRSEVVACVEHLSHGACHSDSRAILAEVQRAGTIDANRPSRDGALCPASSLHLRSRRRASRTHPRATPLKRQPAEKRRADPGAVEPNGGSAIDYPNGAGREIAARERGTEPKHVQCDAGLETR